MAKNDNKLERAPANTGTPEFEIAPTDDTMDFYEVRVIWNNYKSVYLQYYIDIRKNYCMYNGDRRKFIKDWQTNLKSGMTLFFTESTF
jgi:hypothetical protein